MYFQLHSPREWNKYLLRSKYLCFPRLHASLLNENNWKTGHNLYINTILPEVEWRMEPLPISPLADCLADPSTNPSEVCFPNTTTSKCCRARNISLHFCLDCRDLVLPLLGPTYTRGLNIEVFYLEHNYYQYEHLLYSCPHPQGDWLVYFCFILTLAFAEQNDFWVIGAHWWPAGADQMFSVGPFPSVKAAESREYC